MAVVTGLAGVLLILGILLDVFETVVLPRRVRRKLSPTRLFYRLVWRPWSAPVRYDLPFHGGEGYLSIFGPLSLLALLAVWIAGLIAGFALLQWTFGRPLVSPLGVSGFGTYLYMSGTTLMTLGLGDVVPHSPAARALTVIEVATGFAVLAVVIGYLPVLYQAFSRREVSVTMLDARAGSPPSAGELLIRHGQPENAAAIDAFFRSWEQWAAELMEGHLSYPALAYYRSQHEHQSWLAALTTILDTAALVMTGVDGVSPRTARLAFATARHAAVDLTLIFSLQPEHNLDRLTRPDLDRLREMAAAGGVVLRCDDTADRKLAHLRAFYEPYVAALSRYLLMPLPPWLPTEETREYWRRVL